MLNPSLSERKCHPQRRKLAFVHTYAGSLPLFIHTSVELLINSTEAGNLLRGNDALHAMLGARRRARVQFVLVKMMFICLIARLLVQATPQSC